MVLIAKQLEELEVQAEETRTSTSTSGTLNRSFSRRTAQTEDSQSGGFFKGVYSWVKRITVRKSNSDSDDEEDEKSGGVFLDASAMKEKIRQAAFKKEYTVCDFYHETGKARWLATHPRFEKATLAVIAFNAIWISIDTDNNTADTLVSAEPIFILAENVFCVYFFFEWIVRFCAFKRKRDGCRDAWFVFDTCLVMFMVFETWIMSAILLAIMLSSPGGNDEPIFDASILSSARLLRLARMARMARLLKAMPELLILIKGIGSATRSVVFTLMLLFIITYIFGIVFRQLTDLTPAGVLYFPSVWHGMHTLLRDGTLMDSPGVVVRALEKQDWTFVVVFYVFILLAALTVMNMLIGVLCEVVSAVAATEKEGITVSYVRQTLTDIMHQASIDCNEGMSKDQFATMLQLPEASRSLAEVGVDCLGLVDNLDFIFAAEEESADGEPVEKHLSMAEFFDMILELRGTNAATVKDMVELRKFMRGCEEDVGKELTKMFEKMQVDSSQPSSRMIALGRGKKLLNADTIRDTASLNTHEGERDVGDRPALNDVLRMTHRPPSNQVEAPAVPPSGTAAKPPGAAELRGQLVRTLAEVQRHSYRFLDCLPLSDGDSTLEIPRGEIRRFEELLTGTSSRGKSGQCHWSVADIQAARAKVMQLQIELSSSLASLQRLRETSRCKPSAPR